MWVNKWKADLFEWPTTAKSSLVARENRQRADIDFGEWNAPTVALASVRLLTALT